MALLGLWESKVWPPWHSYIKALIDLPKPAAKKTAQQPLLASQESLWNTHSFLFSGDCACRHQSETVHGNTVRLGSHLHSIDVVSELNS